jgi:hypothetical protein
MAICSSLWQGNNFKLGEVVEYYSTSQGWIPAKAHLNSVKKPQKWTQKLLI